jgi:hypothetical protein
MEDGIDADSIGQQLGMGGRRQVGCLPSINESRDPAIR